MTDAEVRAVAEGFVPASLIAKVQRKLESAPPLEGQFCIDDYPEVYEKGARNK